MARHDRFGWVIKEHHIKALSVIAVLSAALLGACGHFPEHHGRYLGQDSSRPVLLVDGSSSVPSIAVSPGTLVFLSGQKNVEIIWTLPKSDNPGARSFKFVPGKGIDIRGEVKLKVIRIEGTGNPKNAFGNESNDVTFLDPNQDQIVDCKILGDGSQYRCLNKNTRPGRYKYSIQLTDGKDSFVVDPQIENW